MDIVELKGVTKHYGSTRALTGLDLSVGQGRVHGLLGPNGAGKSTTLRLILGLDRISGGEVTVFGLNPATSGETIRSRTATVPSDVTLWPTLRGGDVIETVAGLRTDCSATKRRELLERFHLDPHVRCRDYSSGNRQKVLLVAALQARADLYVLDEPTNGLDPLVDATFRDVVREERARGATVVLSSHVLADVDTLADDVTLIRSGRRVETGSLDALRHLHHLALSARVDSSADPRLLASGVSNLRRDGAWVRGEVAPESLSAVLTALGDTHPDDVRLSAPTLETLFLTHYRETTE